MQIPNKFPIALASTALVGIVAFTVMRPKGTDLLNQAKDLSPIEVSKVAKNITVQIDGTNPGSGVLIERQGNTYTVLTAAHVVETEDDYEVITPDRQRHPIELKTIKRFPKIDLAILKFTSPQRYRTAEIGDSTQITEGTSSYVSGFRLKSTAGTEASFRFSSGQIFANASHPLSDGYALVYDNPTFHGMSGGPVLNQKGQLIGVHGRSLSYTPNANMATEINKTSTGQQVLAADVKGGAFNLAIPTNTFLSLTPSIDSTLGLRTAVLIQETKQFTAEDYFVRGAAKSMEGAAQEAIAQFDQAIRLQPSYASAYLGRAGLISGIGNFQKALQDCDRAIQLQPGLASAYNTRSSLRVMGEMNNMLKSFNGANIASKTPKIELDRGLLQKSLTDSNEAIRQKPDDPSFYLGRAAVRNSLKDNQGAIADYQKAADLYQALGDLPSYQFTMSSINFLKRTMKNQ
jgi:S1-C subfamily serine protease